MKPFTLDDDAQNIFYFFKEAMERSRFGGADAEPSSTEQFQLGVLTLLTKIAFELEKINQENAAQAKQP